MDKAELLDKETWIEINIEEYKRRITGKVRNSQLWPELRCVSCKKTAIARGLATATENYPAHFAHKDALANGEFCPLSSNTRRFVGLDGNNRNLSSIQAKERRCNFMTFDSLCCAYIICRKLRGGKGKLTQSTFIEMIRVADSYGIWSYSYLPEWGIPLSLMLMVNHPTPNGRADFFYIIKKDRRKAGVKWENLNIRLEAHWVSDGSKINPDKSKNPSFEVKIPFNQQVVKDILDSQDMS